MGDILILLAVVLGAIGVMVLFNKLLEYLFYKFTIIYNVILIAIAALSNLSLINNPPAMFPYWYLAVQILYFYLQFTRVDSASWKTKETTIEYNDYKGAFESETTEVSHYQPGWWSKLLIVAIASTLAVVLSYYFAKPVITLILELLLPLLTILLYLRTRRKS